MPIVHFTWAASDVPADAQNVRVQEGSGRPYLYINGKYHDCAGPCRPMWTYETQVGKCLYEREHNMRDDSDFYMTYWDEAQERPVNVMFATTRGWSYPAMASRVDATPEVKAKYEAWRKEQARLHQIEMRKAQAAALRAKRAELQALASDFNVSYFGLLRLRKAYAPAALDNVLRLFGKRVRNSFRLKMRQQVIDWCNCPAPKYPTPLSRKQMEYV